MKSTFIGKKSFFFNGESLLKIISKRQANLRYFEKECFGIDAFFSTSKTQKGGVSERVLSIIAPNYKMYSPIPVDFELEFN